MTHSRYYRIKSPESINVMYQTISNNYFRYISNNI